MTRDQQQALWKLKGCVYQILAELEQLTDRRPRVLETTLHLTPVFSFQDLARLTNRKEHSGFPADLPVAA